MFKENSVKLRTERIKLTPLKIEEKEVNKKVYNEGVEDNKTIPQGKQCQYINLFLASNSSPTSSSQKNKEKILETTEQGLKLKLPEVNIDLPTDEQKPDEEINLKETKISGYDVTFGPTQFKEVK